MVQLWLDRELLLTLANLVLVMFGDGLKHGTHEFVKGHLLKNKNLIVVFRQRPSKSETVFDKVKVSLKLKIPIKIKVIVVYSTYSNKPLLGLLRSRSS